MKTCFAVYPHSTPSFAAREAGGKGHNLFLMATMGLPVPPWVILGRSFFRRFAQVSSFETALADCLGRLENGNLKAAEEAATIERLIVGAAFPAEFDASLRQALGTLGPGAISVRSSASDEDGGSRSFAGQLSSYLYVQGEPEIKECIQKCWASAFSERALTYRLHNRLPLQNIGIAVVLQQMIDPDKSGVMFTCDPVEERPDRFLISSVYGAGEGLVSGALDADSFWLDAATGQTTRQLIAHKTHACRRTGVGRTGLVAVPAELQEIPSLNPAELKNLFSLQQQILARFGRPQDIEWAIAQGKVWLLQTRPVTTLRQEPRGCLNLWDNSNIIESYGGLTSPLSFSFALRNYRNVYIQFCEVLSVPPSVIKDLDECLGHMLGSLNGRVYYNLFNWYRLVGILPGFEQNRGFMETMMGVSESLRPEIAERIRPHESWDKPVGTWYKFKTGLRFLFYHFRIQSLVDAFLKGFHREYLRYRNRDYHCMRGDEIIRLYLEMERTMLRRWQAPIINDFLCMVHFGLLRKLTTRWFGQVDASIFNDLFSGEGNLESAEPTRALLRLAGQAAANPGLKQLLQSVPPADALEALNQSPYRDFYLEVLQYIDRFGFRCMNEMKLEETDLYTDSSYFFICLQNYLRGDTTDLNTTQQREQKLRAAAEQKVFAHLRGPKRWVYAWVLKQARKAVKNRENTRFARTRIYGVARTMFHALGEDLAAGSLLDRPADIFFLTLDEVLGIYQGTLACYDLKALAAARKQAFAKFQTDEPKPRFMTRGPVYWKNAFLAAENDGVPTRAADPSADLTGLPCCPGIVEGNIKVVTNPHDDLKLNGEILVAPRTDPGWVPLYPSIRGLLVERGSLLSHSAIVAREMGLPTIVSVRGLISTLKTGMRVRIDGKAGTIKIL